MVASFSVATNYRYTDSQSQRKSETERLNTVSDVQFLGGKSAATPGPTVPTEEAIGNVDDLPW